MSTPSFRDRFRYRTDQFFQSGFTLQLVVSAVVITGVIGVFYIISETLGVLPGADFDIPPGESDPFWPSTRFWWVLMHVMESYWIERATLPQLMSLLMTLFNLIVLAALVGLFGSRIQQRLEQVRRGTSLVVEEGHIVIIGWSGKTLPIMHELLVGLEGARPVFVLHTERPLEEIDRKIRRVFNRRQARWVIRQGSLTDMRELELLNIGRARTIVILSQEGDAQVVKSIMAVAHLVRSARSTREVPLIVAEIARRPMMRLARAAARDVDISIVQPAEQLSRIILQTARQQGLVNVYDEILSHAGNELHFTEAAPLAGRSWTDAMFAFPAATPLGILRRGIPLLSPHSADANLFLEASDVVICLARSDDDMRIDANGAPPAPLPVEAVPDTTPVTEVRNVLLLGWNEKAQPLLEEYARYAAAIGARFDATVVSTAIPGHFSPVLLGQTAAEALSIELLREDSLGEGVLERVRPECFDAVIILGEKGGAGDTNDADTNVIMLLLLLHSMRERAALTEHPFPARQQIVSEILDPANKALAESTGAAQDVIISNSIVSRMIAQICRDKRTESVMRDLFDEEGMEIYMKPASWYAGVGSEVSIGQLQLAALEAGETAIGLERNSGASVTVELNPSRDTVLSIDDSLRLIVISENEGRSTQRRVVATSHP